jgi:hypothetical protein
LKTKAGFERKPEKDRKNPVPEWVRPKTRTTTLLFSSAFR